jgi:hypothetical protein
MKADRCLSIKVKLASAKMKTVLRTIATDVI